jgi:hypothetical protein
MAEKKGFVAIDRNIENWKWYSDAVTFRVWMHILIKCNYGEGNFRGIEIKPGQWFTSYDHMADSLKISKSQARTAISHLKLTHEIACDNARSGLLITVINWEKYNFSKNSSHANRTQKRTQIAGKSHAKSQANRTNNTKKQCLSYKVTNRNIDDDKDFYLNLYRVGFEDDPSIDELSKLEDMVSNHGYANVLSALKQSRKFKGKGIAYTISIMNNRKGKAKPFDPDRDISKVIGIISVEADQLGPDQKNKLQAAAEDLKKYYSDYEMILALRNCEVYNAFDAESFCKEMRNQFLERGDESYD